MTLNYLTTMYLLQININTYIYIYMYVCISLCIFVCVCWLVGFLLDNISNFVGYFMPRSSRENSSGII